MKELDIETIYEEFGKLFGKNETVDKGYKLRKAFLGNDCTLIFSNKRLINAVSISLNDILYITFPYNKICEIRINSKNNLMIWLLDRNDAFVFNLDQNAFEIQSILADHL